MLSRLLYVSPCLYTDLDESCKPITYTLIATIFYTSEQVLISAYVYLNNYKFLYTLTTASLSAAKPLVSPVPWRII